MHVAEMRSCEDEWQYVKIDKKLMHLKK